MCICGRESIDQVIARMAFFGVGNLVGSINVLSLESTKFYRPLVTKDTKEPSSTSTDAAQDADMAEQVQRKKKIINEAASQIRVEQVVESIKVRPMAHCSIVLLHIGF